jgi:hypothetical protein
MKNLVSAQYAAMAEELIAAAARSPEKAEDLLARAAVFQRLAASRNDAVTGKKLFTGRNRKVYPDRSKKTPGPVGSHGA